MPGVSGAEERMQREQGVGVYVCMSVCLSLCVHIHTEVTEVRTAPWITLATNWKGRYS